MEIYILFFFFNDTATTEIYTLSLHDALPIFELQTPDYRDEVLPPDVKARVSVEAGVGLGWRRWVGDEGDCVSIERFGASAPGATVLEHLGFTVDNVVA